MTGYGNSQIAPNSRCLQQRVVFAGAAAQERAGVIHQQQHAQRILGAQGFERTGQHTGTRRTDDAGGGADAQRVDAVALSRDRNAVARGPGRLRRAGSALLQRCRAGFLHQAAQLRADQALRITQVDIELRHGRTAVRRVAYPGPGRRSGGAQEAQAVQRDRQPGRSVVGGL